VDVDRRISRIFIDTTQLERTLLNLVLNARDAMPAGGDLVVRAEDTFFDNEDGDRDTFVMITVIDSGMGMDEATRANIFKPFFTTKGENGTGLGLAIVDQIVARAGGFIQVDSEPGKGTSVRLFIPRIADASN
jgi:signal transduction histidine kinase